MANIEITNNAPFGIVISDPVFEDEIVLSAGADTLAPGTLLGRITASGKLTIYTSGAGDGSQIPKAVLKDELVFAGAGDLPCRPIIAGRLRRADLVADGVGAITDAEADQLRDYGIIALNVNQLAELDNQ